ncbi:MAG TPA: two-component regulator propeller domain-containing protein, partial [Candidatus Aminicenantes bacterium]|nr:two-component regulator propeller domain-containing protein [Candidatus Aminicenantes bacterium]
MLSWVRKGLFSLLLLSLPLEAQDLLLRQWSLWEGLPTPTVTAIARSSDGWLWLGTPEGLLRFDGSRFFPLEEGDTKRRVLSLLPLSSGDLWVGFEGGGPRLLHSRSGRFDPPPEGLKELSVYSLLVDRGGNLWAGTERGLYVKAAGKSLFALRSDGPRPPVTSLLEDPKGVILAGGNGEVVSLLKGSRRVVTSLFPGLVRSLLIRRDGSLAIGGEGGLVLEEGGRLLPPYGPPLRALVEDQEGLLWGASEGEGLLKREGREWTPLGVAQGIPDDWINSLLWVSQTKTLWAGSVAGGLLRLSPKAWSPVKAFPEEETKALTLLPGGALWAILSNDSLLGLQGGQRLTASLKETPLSLASSAEGRLWVGSREGTLYLLSPRGGVERRFALKEGPLLCLVKGEGERLWAGTDRSLLLLQEGEVLQRVPASGVRELLLGREGTLWAATDKGLLELKPSKAPLLHPSPPLLSLFSTPGRGLLLGSRSNGIGLFLGNRFFFDRGALDGENILWMVRDKGGRLWAGTSRGILRLSHTPEQEFSTTGSLEIRHLLDTPEAKPHSSPAYPLVTTLRDGKIYAASRKGVLLNTFDGEPPPLSGLWVEGPLCEDQGSEGRLSKRCRRPVLRIFLPGEEQRGEHLLKISLKGPLEKTLTAKAGTLSLPPLPPGHYTLTVTARELPAPWEGKFRVARELSFLPLLSLLLIGGGTVTWALFRRRGKGPSRPLLPAEETTRIASLLSKAMEGDRLYRDPLLSLPRLAERLS